MALSRQAWVAASGFVNDGDRAVFTAIVEDVRSPRGRVILDLDSTLFDVRPRWIATFAQLTGTGRKSEILDVLARVTEADLGYSVFDTLTQAGIDITSPAVRSELESLKGQWRSIFFSDDMLEHDRASPGAPEFVQDLAAHGVDLVYLTGRAERLQHGGTLRALARCGFPVDGTRLLTNRSPEQGDLAHKQKAIKDLAQGCDWGWSFENEPANLVAMHRIAPNLRHVFVHTECSDTPAPPATGLYRVSGFTAWTQLRSG